MKEISYPSVKHIWVLRIVIIEFIYIMVLFPWVMSDLSFIELRYWNWLPTLQLNEILLFLTLILEVEFAQLVSRWTVGAPQCQDWQKSSWSNKTSSSWAYDFSSISAPVSCVLHFPSLGIQVRNSLTMPTATQVGVVTILICIVFLIATIIFGLGFSIVPVRIDILHAFFSRPETATAAVSHRTSLFGRGSVCRAFCPVLTSLMLWLHGFFIHDTVMRLILMIAFFLHLPAQQHWYSAKHVVQNDQQRQTLHLWQILCWCW